MNKFITPVSMNVSREKGDSLVKKLNNLGYTLHKAFDYSLFNDTLCTNRGNYNYQIGFLNDYTRFSNNRYFISDYNPELFLALAAMTSYDDPIIGEYMICIKNTENCLYNNKIGDIFPIKSFNKGNKAEEGHFADGWSRKHFRKATKEELIAHFSKDTFVLPERWFVRTTSDETDRVLINWRGGTYSGSRKDSVMTSSRFWMNKDCVKEYTEITFEQFEEHVLKQKIKQTKIEMKHTINLDQLRSIYNIACSGWKEKIKHYAGRAIFPQVTVDFTDSEVKAMYDASNTEQKVLLNTIFTEYNKDTNPFKEHEDNKSTIAKLSKDCFGNSGAIMLTSVSADYIRRENLKDRSLSVDSEYEVVLHEGKYGNTVIEFKHK